MAIAHVGEGVFVAELLIAGLEVDFGVVFGADAVDVVVAVVDVDVDAAERVDHFDEALEGRVDDAVELDAEQVLDRFGREACAAVGALERAADRVGAVDLFGVVDLARRGDDLGEEVARDREHRGLPLVGVQAHQQHRVAVGRIGAIEGALGLGALVGAD